jgi:hypothetical protein
MDNKTEVEIYLNQFITFFEKNPNDLMDLIGDSDKNNFFKKVKEQCFLNLENGDDVTLSHKQIIDIVLSLKPKKTKSQLSESPFLKTKYGNFFLN